MDPRQRLPATTTIHSQRLLLHPIIHPVLFYHQSQEFLSSNRVLSTQSPKRKRRIQCIYIYIYLKIFLYIKYIWSCCCFPCLFYSWFVWIRVQTSPTRLVNVSLNALNLDVVLSLPCFIFPSNLLKKSERLFWLVFQVLDFADCIPIVMTSPPGPSVSDKVVISQEDVIWFRSYVCGNNIHAEVIQFHQEAYDICVISPWIMPLSTDNCQLDQLLH